MAVIHAKDFVLQNGEIISRPAGQGCLDYRLLLKTLKASKPCINVLLEEAGEGVIDDCLKYFEGVYAAA